MDKNKRFDKDFSNGKIELRKIGNNVSSKNHYSSEKISDRNKIIAPHIEDVKNEIDNLIYLITQKVKSCDPLFLLLSATDIMQHRMLNVVSEIQIDQDSIFGMQLVEYIQSILVSQPFDRDLINEEEQTKTVMEIVKYIEELYKKCMLFNFVWGVQELEKGKIKQKDIDYIVESQIMSNVRGHRYQFQQLDDLEKLLAPHSEKLFEVYGETSESIIAGLKKMEIGLSSGKLDAFNELFNVYKEFQKECEGKSFEEIGELLEKIRRDVKIQDCISKCLEADLYDVKKVTNWDERLINSLSWNLGENTDLFQKSEYPGWPIQDLPVQKRPFISIDGVVYCFDYYNLFDNIYRVLQKNLKEKDPAYANGWAKKQQDASESLVAEKFANLLPNANIYIGNYYPISGSLKQMDENDIFVVCDDVVIIVEVKAGSFTYTPAITDYGAHKKSFEALIGKADYQCIRTQEYFTNNGNTVFFYNNDKTEKFKVDRSKIRRIYTMCVTIDNFNVFEAKIEKTNFFNSNSGTIAISIDDLDVYEDYFESEICFLHYLKHRKAATRIKNLTLSDELDHLGLYISQNVYENYANDFKDFDYFIANGFREDLDAYYAGVHNKLIAREKPVQIIPQSYHEIFTYLEENKIAGRIDVGELLLDFAYDERERFDESIKGRIIREKQLGYITPMWAEFGYFSYCCFVNLPGLDSFSEHDRKRYIYSNMLDRKQDICWYLLINVNSCGKIKSLTAEKMFYSNHKDDGVTDNEINFYIDKIKEKRKNQGVFLPPAHKKKIYPNDLCPCGSGIKYKKCCGKIKK